MGLWSTYVLVSEPVSLHEKFTKLRRFGDFPAPLKALVSTETSVAIKDLRNVYSNSSIQ